jgi:DNA (cytosine-5)-methyltransferase 1
VVAGGPPCQGFSMANRQRLIDDPRNHLYKSYVAVINKLHPKFIVMENVRGILSVMDQIDADFSTIGYSVKAKLLNAKDFGIPQNRERVIVIGNCLGIDNESIFGEILEKSSKMTSVNLEDAIADLRPLEAKRRKNNTEIEDSKSGFNITKKEVAQESAYVKLINKMGDTSILFNHKARYNNDRDIEIFGRLDPGDNSTDPKISDIMPYKRRERIFKDKYYKLEMDKPCKTITAHMKYDCNMYIHPNQARGLTPREAARVQSFPDDYFFRGSYTKTYMQIGNSVPPLLSKTIAEVIKNRLEGLNGCV